MGMLFPAVDAIRGHCEQGASLDKALARGPGQALLVGAQP